MMRPWHASALLLLLGLCLSDSVLDLVRKESNVDLNVDHSASLPKQHTKRRAVAGVPEEVHEPLYCQVLVLSTSRSKPPTLCSRGQLYWT